MCDEVIIEGDDDKGEPGDDAMYCEGKCKIHGYTENVLASVNSNMRHYLQRTPHCTLGKQAVIINELKDLVNTLSADILSLKSQVADLKTNQVQPSTPHNDTVDQPCSNEADIDSTTRPPQLSSSADKYIKTMFNDYINMRGHRKRDL